MLNLMPVELHEFSLRDFFHGTLSGLQPSTALRSIQIPGIGKSIPIRSGRVALIVALRSLRLRPGSIIGVPLYCCPVIFKAIKAAGHSVRFLDIDSETYCLSCEDLKKKSSELDALITVHMFGHLCDMPEILHLMNGKPVIEDCAQSIGSLLNGRPSGTFGDISFFSFRSGKHLSGGEGGALYSNRNDLRAKIEENVISLPSPGCTEEIMHMILTFIRSKIRNPPWWGLLGSKIWTIYNRNTSFADKAPISLSQIYSSDLAIARKRILLLERVIASQRAHADYYAQNLRLAPGMQFSEKNKARYNRLMYPIRFRTIDERHRMASYLFAQGIGASTPYEDATEGAAEHYGYQNDCPFAEGLLKRTLVIPCHYKLTKNNLESIVINVNRGWALIKKRLREST